MASLQASLFRTLRVTCDEGRPLDLGSPTTRSLFAYLLLNRGRPVERRRLAFTFWPGVTETAARRNLRQYLHRLRRALEPANSHGELIISEDPLVQINPEVDLWVDIDAFRRATTPDSSLEDLRAAAEIYTGDLLEDMYDEWCEEERRSLRQRYFNLLDRLSQGLQSLGLCKEALVYAQKWASADPLDETAHRRLMSLYTLTGDRNQAILHYQAFREMLSRELDTEPLPETQALFLDLQAMRAGEGARLSMGASPQAITNGEGRLRSSPRSKAGAAIPLVGRQNELSLLQQLIEPASQGSGGFILVTGESGIGKTRLVEEFMVQNESLVALHGLCHELEFMVPYAPLRQILAQAFEYFPDAALQPVPSWLMTLAHFIPNLAARLPFLPAKNHPDEETPRLQEAINQLILELARRLESKPLVLVLDDLHWGDGPTWDILVQLANYTAEYPLLIFGLCRLEDLPAERNRLVRVLERNERLARLNLERLTPQETADLARSLLHGETADEIFLNRLHKETEGNPFFVIETVRSMQESGRVLSMMLEPGINPSLNLPLSIQRVIEARLDRLTSESQDLLSYASAIGSAFSFSMLEEIAQITGEICLQHLEEWSRRGLVRETAGGYDFSHDKLRQVAYISLSQARRQFVHRRIAEVFETTYPPTDPATLAYHYSRSDQPLRALSYLTQSGEQALRVRSYHEARQFGLRAVSLLGRMPGPRQRAERIDLNLQLAQAYAFSGDLERALEILVETEHLAASLGDEERLGKIFHRSAQIFWLRGQPETAGDYARRALRSAEELNDPSLLQAALRMLGRVGIAISAFDDAIAYLLRYINLKSGPLKPPDLSVVHGYLGIAYARVGSWNRAVETAGRGVNLAEAEGSDHTVLFARMQLGFVFADAHRWQTCLETLGLDSQPGELTITPVVDPTPNEPGPTSPVTPLGFMCSALRGRALVQSGQVLEGLQLIRAALGWAEQNDYRVFHYLPRLFLAESLMQNQQFSAAQAQAEIALEQAQAAGNRWAVGLTRRTLAESLARQSAQNWALIEDHLIQSMLILRQIRARPDLARTYLAMRRLYDRAGQIAWAVDCHFRATSIFEELDMGEELLQAQGQAAGDRRGAVVISGMRLRGPNVGEET